MHRPYDPRQDPETERKLRSGLWRRDMDMETGGVRWTLDLFLLEDKVREIMRHPRDAEMFHRDPERCLDMLFGEGTGRAYFTKRRDYYDRHVMFNENPYHMRMEECRTRSSVKKNSNKSSPYKSLVKTMPFSEVSWINGECSLISQLQQEFDHWAGKQLQSVQSWSKPPLKPSDLTVTTSSTL